MNSIAAGCDGTLKGEMGYKMISPARKYELTEGDIL